MALQKISNSCKLVQGMAERLGAEVTPPLETDPETIGRAYREAVLRCASCEQQEDCKDLQANNDTLSEAPSYCRNSWQT